MHHYTLLIFAATDEVVGTQALRAASLEDARRMADHILQTRPGAAGYQLWQDGGRVHTTFPVHPSAGAWSTALWGKRD